MQVLFDVDAASVISVVSRPITRFLLSSAPKQFSFSSRWPRTIPDQDKLRKTIEAGREACQSLAATVMQYLGSMGAAGIGMDSPLSMGSAQNNGEEENKQDYRADDEDKYDDDIDNSFDYTPEVSYTVASESSEDFDGGEVRKDDNTEQKKDATQVIPPPNPPKNEDEEKVSPPPHKVDAKKIDAEDCTVLHDRTVVTQSELAVDQSSGEIRQDNKLIAITSTSSTAVDDRANMELLGSTRTEVLSDNSFLTSDDNDATSSDLRDVGYNVAAVLRAESLDDELDEKMSKSKKKPSAIVQISLENEQPAEAVETMEVDQEDAAVSKTQQSGDTAQRADDERSDAMDPQEEQSQQNNASTSLKSPDSLPDIEGVKSSPKSKKAQRPAKAMKRKQAQRPLSDVPTEDGTVFATPPKTIAATPIQTTKRPRRASSKKYPANTDEGESKQENSPPLRRSSRIKTEPPKVTCPVKVLARKEVMSHFNRSGGSKASTPATRDMSCKYCGKLLIASRGVASRHLSACHGFELQEQVESKLDEVDDIEEKPAAPLSHALVEVPSVKAEVPWGHNASTRSTRSRGLAEPLVQLMGSSELANKLKGAFQHSLFAGHGPVSRFQELIRDDVTGLRHLRVQNLLEAVDAQDGPVAQLHAKRPGVLRITGQDILDAVSKAKARNLVKFPLRFPAPRSVAEHFIRPLANELGLEYAMSNHKASVVSCPQEGTLLDWRFHRTETVLFQLGGESLCKMKMGQVEHPLQCFHPESWLLDDVAHVAKTHRVASMNKDALGFLSAPGEDLEVFDDSEIGDVGEEQHEHMLKPGSVAYLPAGAWFEIETQGSNSLWLEVQLSSMTYQDLVFSALKQLAWSDKQWRMGVQLYPGDRSQTKATRHHAEACIKLLKNEMMELEGSDLLPEYLCTVDMQNLVAQGILHDVRTSIGSTSFEVDLTSPRFKLKHKKIFKDAAYRVNPVAVLLNADEIPHLRANEDEELGADDAHGVGNSSMHHALKKKPKPKRKQALRAITHSGKHTYMIDEVFGNDKLKSQMHVKFQCSTDQSRKMEWLRGRGAEPFDLEEFNCCDSTLYQCKSSTRCEESARNLLRFLCFVGYVTQVK
ncbi:unnamed protein product [Phytophthora fragariaefolia]|uniref:Unnamed protein product n=1 Tax=Phytophthora fragariaefolia TaxID=1490495 RepID=A0A9W6YCY8_9STRA|nr:unnamed protein product [Phytophthora fragariaefolia]